tara:strand:- start:1128 stop:1280 length:153 start_codon:yes stop_codon:yes gene_type:complete
MDRDFIGECEECDNTTIVLNVHSDDKPEFCSICGRRLEYEEKEDVGLDFC